MNMMAGMTMADLAKLELKAAGARDRRSYKPGGVPGDGLAGAGCNKEIAGLRRIKRNGQVRRVVMAVRTETRGITLAHALTICPDIIFGTMRKYLQIAKQMGLVRAEQRGKDYFYIFDEGVNMDDILDNVD
jgi:hypothetical protein